MSFYYDWKNTLTAGDKDETFLRRFLDCSPESLDVLSRGEKEDVIEAIKLLLSIPISRFLGVIDHSYSFLPKDVFQFSKLEDATDALCNILEYDENSISYEKAGRLLTHALQKYACIKYGENHAKTAAMMSLVSIEKPPVSKCNLVSVSALGSVSTTISPEDRHELIKRLAIRNPLIKSLIYDAKEGEASYYKTVSTVLSGQTIIRRRHNNEIIMNLILEDEDLKDKIRWK